MARCGVTNSRCIGSKSSSGTASSEQADAAALRPIKDLIDRSLIERGALNFCNCSTAINVYIWQTTSSAAPAGSHEFVLLHPHEPGVFRARIEGLGTFDSADLVLYAGDQWRGEEDSRFRIYNPILTGETEDGIWHIYGPQSSEYPYPEYQRLLHATLSSEDLTGFGVVGDFAKGKLGEVLGLATEIGGLVTDFIGPPPSTEGLFVDVPVLVLQYHLPIQAPAGGSYDYYLG